VNVLCVSHISRVYISVILQEIRQNESVFIVLIRELFVDMRVMTVERFQSIFLLFVVGMSHHIYSRVK